MRPEQALLARSCSRRIVTARECGLLSTVDLLALSGQERDIILILSHIRKSHIPYEEPVSIGAQEIQKSFFEITLNFNWLLRLPRSQER